MAYTSLSHLIDSSRNVSDTYAVIINLEQLVSAIREAESGQRAYLLTSNPDFLEGFYGKRQKVNELYRTLRQQVSDNEEQQTNLRRLQELITQRFERLGNLVSQHQKNQPYNIVGSNQMMQELTSVVDTMQEEEERLLEMRLEREQLYARQAPVFIGLFLLVSLLLTLTAFFRIRKDVRERERTEKLLENYNQKLEGKIEERTREIRKNEERYRFMAESIPHIVWTATPEGEMDFFSQQLTLYTGIPTEELLGRNWQRIIHPAELEATFQVWARSISEETENRIEHRILGADGQYRWMLSHAVPYKSEKGDVLKWFGTTTLIDEEKKAIDKAIAKEEQLRQITDALPVLISYIDEDRRYRFVNAAYERWFGISRNQINAKPLREVVGGEGYKAVSGLLDRAFRGETINEEVKTYYPLQGHRYMRIHIIPRWHDDRVLGVYGLVTDITQQREIEEQLREALFESRTRNEELKRVNLILDDFVTMAAHDLKSPVSNLKLSVLLMNRLGSAEEKLKIMGQFDTSVQRLDRTLSGLLEILEVQHVKDAQVAQYCFADILEQVMENLGERLQAAGGTIESDFVEAPAIAYIRPYLVSIFHNLISNAVKYRSGDRPLQIMLRTEVQEQWILFSCTDNGIGMNMDKIGSKIFKPFKRFTAQAEGTGVGLHLVKSMLEKNGGKIEIESREGKGSIVRCYLKEMIKTSDEK
ncbi:sensor histidine kinase [Nafulsella turpanensis]|uniref:sensor histidine kinase n=1 Tax=Nafulsella turpanensis TaxID=1265690 RepID=UPI00135F161E|nr:PAS domain S-box protein [Nafulsella turpanensis]